MAIDTSSLLCGDADQRRSVLLDHPTLNGIDYVEVDPSDHRLLRLFFFKPVPPLDDTNPADLADAYGLSADPSRIQISGGQRVVGIKTNSIVRGADGYLDLVVDQPGDFSAYTLTIDIPQLDPFFQRVSFSFMAACPVDFDCREETVCLPTALDEPLLDYLAKDYASFRRLMLDLLPQLNPDFVERNPSDLGIALIELVAHTGDHLSYYQDAVANEAYLRTARQRISARRHARLVDYRMHDGRNAWTHVHIAVSSACSLPQGTKALTRITAPLPGSSVLPGPELDADLVTADALELDPAFASVRVFETMHAVALDPTNNEIRIHTWGNEECCHSTGTTEIFLYSLPEGTNLAVRPSLEKDDYLLFEEVRGPQTGVAADANPTHRQIVRVTEVAETEDPLYKDELVDDELQKWGAEDGDHKLPLLRVRWSREDALTFPLCISTRPTGVGETRNISIARGNLALADHGLTVTEEAELLSIGSPVRLRLERTPLTMECASWDRQRDSETGLSTEDRHELDCDVREAAPSIAVFVTTETGRELWTAAPDLLDSTPFSQHFVVEVDNELRPTIRFGDGDYGKDPTGATSYEAVYRFGNGREGNVGADAVSHLALPAGSDCQGKITSVRNPLAAQGGVDAETIDEVRLAAPKAFAAEQYRAVTEADYATAATKIEGVASAAAGFRWTGSWYTVCAGVDPEDPDDLVNETGGQASLSEELAASVLADLTRYRLAGYDLDVRSPTYVPMEIDLEICVASGHFRQDVTRAVANALSNRVLSDGSLGFFHSDNFSFGQSVYLSRLYAAVEKIEGVASAVIQTFKRYREPDNGELENAVFPIGSWEVARLDNDPNFMEHGVLRVTALGGKG